MMKWTDMNGERERGGQQARACTKGGILFSLSHSMPFACTHYIVQTNKHFELDARKTFLRNKWTSRFIKFMSILTLSAYLIQPSIHLSHSISFYWKERKWYIKQFMQLTWAQTYPHTRMQTKKQHNQFTEREKTRQQNLWKIISLRIMNSSTLQQYIVLHTHLNHRPIKERARQRESERERNEHKQGKSETLIIKIMA